MPQQRKKQSQSAELAVIDQTCQRVRRQRLINVLSFFLPVGAATALVGYTLLTKFSLHLFFMLLPIGTWVGLLASALRQTDTQMLDEHETAAALLDEKTLSKERFVTLATLPRPQAETALFPLLQRETTKRAASFSPERDLPFHFDRRVAVGLLVSVVCLGGSLLIFSLSSQTLSNLMPALPASPSDIAERQRAALTQPEKKALELAQDSRTPQEKMAGEELLTLAKKLKDPTLTPREKERLIEDAEERIQLDLSIPQILPIDLKLFATNNENDEGEGNQGNQKQPDDKVLAKANEPSGQPKKTPSDSSGKKQRQSQKNSGERKEGGQRDGDQQEKAQNRQIQESGGGLKFDQPQQQGEKKKQPGRQQSGEQQKSAAKHDSNKKTQGGDPNRPNELGDQRNQTPDPNKPGPNPNQDRATKPGQGKGINVGKGKAERFRKPGEKPGGFLTKDARFVKVRVPQGYEDQDQATWRVTNTSQAKPKTPYSNAPLKHRQADKIKPTQLIPLEYRAILQNEQD